MGRRRISILAAVLIVATSLTPIAAPDALGLQGCADFGISLPGSTSSVFAQVEIPAGAVMTLDLRHVGGPVGNWNGTVKVYSVSSNGAPLGELASESFLPPYYWPESDVVLEDFLRYENTMPGAREILIELALINNGISIGDDNPGRTLVDNVEIYEQGVDAVATCLSEAEVPLRPQTTECRFSASISGNDSLSTLVTEDAVLVDVLPGHLLRFDLVHSKGFNYEFSQYRRGDWWGRASLHVPTANGAGEQIQSRFWRTPGFYWSRHLYSAPGAVTLYNSSSSPTVVLNLRLVGSVATQYPRTTAVNFRTIDPATGIDPGVPDGPDDDRFVCPVGDANGPSNYYALGDSYAAGDGNEPYEPGTEGDRCRRSTNSWSRQVAWELQLALYSFACQGGVTADFRFPRTFTSGLSEPPQTGRIGENGPPHVISLMIGGNDGGFSDIIKYCIGRYVTLSISGCQELLPRTHRSRERLAGLRTDPAEIIPYAELFREIRARTDDDQDVEFVVVGYPAFFRVGDSRFRGLFCAEAPVKWSDRDWIARVTHDMNVIIEKTARAEGFLYVNPNDAFEGHRMCDDGGENWFWPVASQIPGASGTAFHPRSAGAAAIAELVADELEQNGIGQSDVRVFPGETVVRNQVVAAGLSRFYFNTRWEGSDVEMRLTSPTGRVVDRLVSTADVLHTKGASFEQFRVDDPEAGTWTVEFIGIDVPADGEFVAYRPYGEEPYSATPTAAMAMQRVGSMIRLDGSASSDSDGSIERWHWLVRTNTEDLEFTGEFVEFTANPDAVYEALLTVTDNDGELGFDAGIAHVPDSDVDGDGIEDGNDNCVVIPNADQADSDAFARGDACTGPIDLDLPPLAFDDAVTTSFGTAVTVNVVDGSGGGADAEAYGGVLTVTSVAGFNNGTVTFLNDTVTYTPNSGFSGVDVGTYTVAGRASTASADLVVTVGEPTSLCDGRPVTIDMNIAGSSGIGTAGDDVILGTPGPDVIDALAGDDYICGEGGDDNISGGPGKDFVFGGEGNDTLAGGPGNDRVRGQQGVDTIAGGDGNDFLYGGVEGDTISGDDGNDVIGGFGGSDTIDAGPGDDKVFGGFGADLIDGGPGSDTIRGLVGNDVINGNGGNDVLYGDNGQDTLSGNGGDDTLHGGNSLDTLYGNSGDDSLNGGKADDVLVGGPDTDVCSGNKESTADSADPTCESVFGVP